MSAAGGTADAKFAEIISVGTQIRVDNKYAGVCQYRGAIEGRKGVWLGLDMDDTVGDCDGSVNDTEYFSTHDGHGMFIKDGQGRVTAIGSTNLNDIPEEMKDHMKFLFEAFDTDNSNGIDQKELYTAMKMLGQRCSQSHVKTIFNDIDLDGSGQIDFHEFIEVMEVQWKGLNLAEAVRHIKMQQEAEERKKNPQKEIASQDFSPDVPLVAKLGPINLPLKFFGVGTNLFLLVVYAITGLVAFFLQWLTLPEDLFNILLVISFGAMSALMVIGAWSIKEHRWAAMKVYAMMMLAGAVAQFVLCIVWFRGGFFVTDLAFESAMDRSCGACYENTNELGSIVDGELCHKVGGENMQRELPNVDNDMPWFCCCYQHRCDTRKTTGGGGNSSAVLSDSYINARETCKAQAGYQTYKGTGRTGKSMLGEETCFKKYPIEETGEADMTTCVNEWQSTNQITYVIIMLVLFPVEVLAAYVGWVMPDLYMEATAVAKMEVALSGHDGKAHGKRTATANPLNDEEEGDLDT